MCPCERRIRYRRIGNAVGLRDLCGIAKQIIRVGTYELAGYGRAIGCVCSIGEGIIVSRLPGFHRPYCGPPLNRRQ